MNQKQYLIAGAVIVVFIFGFMFFFKAPAATKTTTNNVSAYQGKMVLFYGNTCPHCAKVESFIKNNNIDQKLSFEQKEVYDNKANAEIMKDLASACNIPINGMGVPFFWDGSKCLIGDEPIINFFSQSK